MPPEPPAHLQALSKMVEDLLPKDLGYYVITCPRDFEGGGPEWIRHIQSVTNLTVRDCVILFGLLKGFYEEAAREAQQKN